MDISLSEDKHFIRLSHCRTHLMLEVQENPPSGPTQLMYLTTSEADALARGLDAVRASLRANWSVAPKEEDVHGPAAVTAALKALEERFSEEKK